MGKCRNVVNGGHFGCLFRGNGCFDGRRALVVKAKVMGVDPSKKRITLSMRALIPEEKKETKEETEDNENFKFEIPPVDSATSTLADFFPKAEGESETEE